VLQHRISRRESRAQIEAFARESTSSRCAHELECVRSRGASSPRRRASRLVSPSLLEIVLEASAFDQ